MPADFIHVHEPAHAKLNLTLHITGKRHDGYHLLDSLVVFADAHDVVEVRPANRLTLAVSGPFTSQLVSNEDNLVLRAAKMLAQHVLSSRTSEARSGIYPERHGRDIFSVDSRFRGNDKNLGAQLILYKNLPVGAGLGGGSADAAATLRALNALWQLGMRHHELQALAVMLGADTAACVASQASHLSGVGDIVRNAPALPKLYVLLANPGAPLLTADVYKSFKGDFSFPPAMPPTFYDVHEFIRFLHNTRNDLEPAAISLLPQIELVKQAIATQSGCLLARMSGSGATCFGLFPTLQAAQKAKQSLSVEHSEWWLWAGGFVNP